MQATCHCGQAGWALEEEIDAVTACNCTLCRRYGALWAYAYEGEKARFFGERRVYTRAGKAEPALEVLFCSECAGVIGYRSLRLEEGALRKITVNIRFAPANEIAYIKLEQFDGLDIFDDLPADGRLVRDVWF